MVLPVLVGIFACSVLFSRIDPIPEPGRAERERPSFTTMIMGRSSDP